MINSGREQLITSSLQLVNYIAGRIASELPGSVEREDLVSTGVLGLIKAVDRFDPTRGVKFETYASCLIRGEIMESLRERDPASRSLRRKTREMGRIISELSTKHGRAPRADEIAEAMGLSLTEYQTMVRHLQHTNVVSLEETIEHDPNVEVRALAADEGAGQYSDPAMALERKEFLALLAVGMEKLPEREQAVLALYYGEEMTLREIGVLFSITESRVCQLHAQALRRLRGNLADDMRVAA
ncbi:MAG TPA: FliA/WhiG family RNA polymerase sigma factor [Armatimonadota bacterium]|jgi:RNA polymerase sigma factor for flagellar operon FliA